MGLFNMEKVSKAFQSKEAFLEYIEAPRAPDEREAIGKGRWSNRDLEPTPPAERNWSWYSLALFWFTTSFGTSGWNAAASLIAVGMTWQQTFIASVLGCAICAVMVTLMARPGVRYHLGFPVLCRAVMGMWGSYFFIFLRGMVCIIWYGIQTYYAANLLSVCFRCMFGTAWDKFGNSLPESAAVTSPQLLCFFLIWFIQLPLIMIHPRQIHWLWSFKGVVMPIATFGLFGWCMANGSGVKSLDLANAKGVEAAKAIPLGWAVMNGINVVLGTLSPMLVNQPDLARYCKNTRDAGWIQAIALFGSKVIILFLGLAATTSMQNAWGEAYWSLWDLLNAILDHHWTGASRTGVWLVSMAYILSCVASNIGANSLPFGADITSLVPKYLTIVRGQVLCAFLGIVVQPWQLIVNAEKFLAFLGSYNIFMAPLCSIWIVDYAFIRKGNLHVPSLFDGSRGSLYWFWSGVNWAGVFAWFAGVSMGIPGLVGQYDAAAASAAAMNMYKMGWLLTFFTAGTIYFGLSFVFRPPIYPRGCENTPTTWEYMVKVCKDGFFDGEHEDVVVTSSNSSDIETGDLADKGDKFTETITAKI